MCEATRQGVIYLKLGTFGSSLVPRRVHHWGARVILANDEHLGTIGYLSECSTNIYAYPMQSRVTHTTLTYLQS